MYLSQNLFLLTGKGNVWGFKEEKDMLIILEFLLSFVGLFLVYKTTFFLTVSIDTRYQSNESLG